MDPVWSLLLLLRPWIDYDYTFIQVVVGRFTVSDTVLPLLCP